MIAPLRLLAGLCSVFLFAGCAHTAGSATSETTIWTARESGSLQNARAEVLGAPRAVTAGGRPAVFFDGVRDGLIFPVNPVAGRRAFTVEVLFKPDGSGPPAQRFVHFEDAKLNRGLIETRITPERQWYLDTFLFAHPREPGLTLVDRTKLHPCDRWYWAALVYDGTTMSHHVNGVKEREGRIEFGPMVEGRTSIGVRLNQVFWYKGEIAEVRFHARALPAAELQTARP